MHFPVIYKFVEGVEEHLVGEGVLPVKWAADGPSMTPEQNAEAACYLAGCMKVDIHCMALDYATASFRLGMLLAMMIKTPYYSIADISADVDACLDELNTFKRATA